MGNNGIQAPLVDFTVNAGAVLGGSATLVCKNMNFGGKWNPADAAASMIVRSCYTPQSTATAYPTLTLGTSDQLATTLDLSGLSSAYDGTALSFAEGSTVTVKLGARTITGDKKVVSWSQAPENVTFVCADGEKRTFAVKDDGLYAYSNIGTVVSLY